MAEDSKSKGSLERILMLGSDNAAQDNMSMKKLLIGLTPFFEHKGADWKSMVSYCKDSIQLTERFAGLKLEAAGMREKGLPAAIAAVLPLVMGESDGLAVYDKSGMKKERTPTMLVGDESELNGSAKFTLQSYLIEPSSERRIMIAPNYAQAGFDLAKSGIFPSALPDVQNYTRMAFLGGPDAVAVKDFMSTITDQGLLPDYKLLGTLAQSSEGLINIFDQLRMFAGNDEFRQGFVDRAGNSFGKFDRAILIFPSLESEAGKEYYRSISPVLDMISDACKGGTRIDVLLSGDHDSKVDYDSIKLIEGSAKATAYAGRKGIIDELAAESDRIRTIAWAGRTGVLPAFYMSLSDSLHSGGSRWLPEGDNGGALVRRAPSDVAVNGSRPGETRVVPAEPVEENRRVVLPGDASEPRPVSAEFERVDATSPAPAGYRGLVDARGKAYDSGVIGTTNDERDGKKGRVETSGAFTDDEIKDAIDVPLDEGTARPGKFNIVASRFEKEQEHFRAEQEKKQKQAEARERAANAGAQPSRQTVSPPGADPSMGTDSTVLNIEATKKRGDRRDPAITGTEQRTAAEVPDAKKLSVDTTIGRAHPSGQSTLPGGKPPYSTRDADDNGVVQAVADASKGRAVTDADTTQKFKVEDMRELAMKTKPDASQAETGRRETTPPPVPPTVTAPVAPQVPPAIPLTQRVRRPTPPIPPHERPAAATAIPPPMPPVRPRPASVGVPPTLRTKPPTGPQAAVRHSPLPMSPMSPIPTAPNSPSPVAPKPVEDGFGNVIDGLQAEQKAVKSLEDMLKMHIAVKDEAPTVLESYRNKYRALLEQFPSGGSRVGLCGSMKIALERITEGLMLDNYFEVVGIMGNKSPAFPDLGGTNIILGESLPDLMSPNSKIPFTGNLFELVKMGVVNYKPGGSRIFAEGIPYIKSVEPGKFKGDAVNVLYEIAKVDIANAAGKTRVFFDKLAELSSEESKELYVSGVKHFGAKAKWKDRLPEISDLLVSRYKSLTDESMHEELDAYRRLKGRYYGDLRDGIIDSVAVAVASLNALEMKEFFSVANNIYYGQSIPASADTAARTGSFIRALPGYQKGAAGLPFKEMADVVVLAASKCDQGGQILVDKGVPVLAAQPEEYRPQVKEMLKSIAAVDLPHAVDKTADIAGIVAEKDGVDKSLYFEGITICCGDNAGEWAGAVGIAKEVLDKLEIIAEQDLGMYRKLLAKSDDDTNIPKSVLDRIKAEAGRDPAMYRKLLDKYKRDEKQDVWSAVDEAVKAMGAAPEGKKHVSDLFSVLTLLSAENRNLPSGQDAAGVIRSDLPGMITSGYYDELKDTVELSLDNFNRGGSTVFQTLTEQVNKYGPAARPVIAGLIHKLSAKAFGSDEAKPGEKAVAVMYAIDELALKIDDQATRVLYFCNVSRMADGNDLDSILGIAGAEADKRVIVSAADQMVVDKLIKQYSIVAGSDKKLDDAFYAGLKSLTMDGSARSPTANRDVLNYVSVVTAAADGVIRPDADQMALILGKSVPEMIKRQGAEFDANMERIVGRSVVHYSAGGREMFESVESLSASYDGKYREQILAIMDKVTEDDMVGKHGKIEKVVFLAEELNEDNRKKYFDEIITECGSKSYGWRLFDTAAQRIFEKYAKLEEEEAAKSEPDVSSSAVINGASSAEREFIEGGKKMEAEAAESEKAIKELESPGRGRKYLAAAVVLGLVGAGAYMLWKNYSTDENLEKKVAGSVVKRQGTDSRVRTDRGAYASAPDMKPAAVATSQPAESYADSGSVAAKAGQKLDAGAKKVYTKVPAPAEKPAAETKVAAKKVGPSKGKASGRSASKRATAGQARHRYPYVRDGVYYDSNSGESYRMGPSQPAESITSPFGGRAINQGAGYQGGSFRGYAGRAGSGLIEVVSPQRHAPGKGYRGRGLK